MILKSRQANLAISAQEALAESGWTDDVRAVFQQTKDRISALNRKGPRPQRLIPSGAFAVRVNGQWCRPQATLFSEDLEPFCETWPSTGSMRDGICSALPKWEPPTSASDSSSLATDRSARPTATQNDSKAGARHTTQTGVMHPGTSLTDAMRQHERSAWPTPAARDYRTPNSEESQERRAEGREAAGQQLPNFVWHLWATPNLPDGGRTLSDEDVVSKGATLKGKRQVDLGNQVRVWATPRTNDGESCGNHPGANDSLTGQTRLWPTPRTSSGGAEPMGRPNGLRLETIAADAGAEMRSIESLECYQEKSASTPDAWAAPTAMDSEQAGGKGATGKTRGPSLHRQMADWPTPTAAPYGSSQNGINGLGGEHERPSANTPSLERLSRSFLLDLQTSTDGDDCSSTGRNSRQQWKTPHGFANTDKHGRTGGGGGEFHKQAMAASDEMICQSTNKPKLNPMFVEFLMNYPQGWTSCALAEMEWCLWWRPSRSAFLRIVSASGLPVATSEKARS